MTVALIQTDDDELADELARLGLLAAVPLARAAPGTPRGAARLLLTDPAGLSMVARGEPLVVVSRGALDARALSAALEAGARAALQLPRDESRLVRLLLDAGSESARGSLIAVVGASGGVGASTFAAALAAASGGAMLIDLERWGGGADLLLGLEDVAGPRWSALTDAHGRVSPTALREALPRWGAVSVLGNDGVDVPPTALLAVGSAAISDGSSAVLDLPRGQLQTLSDSGLAVDVAVLLATDNVPGVGAARRLAPVLRPLALRTHLVVLRASGAVEPALVERAVGLPVGAALSVDPRLSRRALRGMPGLPSRVVLDVARAVLAQWELVA